MLPPEPDETIDLLNPIRVAMYVADGDELWVQNIFQYEWNSHGKTYSFTPTIIYVEVHYMFGR